MWTAIYQTLCLGIVAVLGALAFAVPAAMLWLGWLDRRAASERGPFAESFRRMEADPRALAEYLGRRFSGVCLLVGLVTAAFVILR